MWCIHIVELTRPPLEKKMRFILSDWPDFHMIDNLSIVVLSIVVWRILISLSDDEMLLPRYINMSTNFREPPFRVEISLF